MLFIQHVIGEEDDFDASMAMQSANVGIPEKDRKQIRLLNDCWFYYRAKPDKAKDSKDTLGINP